MEYQVFCRGFPNGKRDILGWYRLKRKSVPGNGISPPLALEKMLYLCDARLAQRLEHLAVNQRVAGSNPAAGASPSASSHKHLH